MAVAPVQLVSNNGVRILNFTTGSSGYEDNGWYTNEFLATAGETYNYEGIYDQLGEVRFLMHLYHAIQSGRGDLCWLV